MGYNIQNFQNENYEALIIAEASWELTLPFGYRIISKTITESEGVYYMKVVYYV